MIISPTAYPTFIFSNKSYLLEEKTVLRRSSVFINCSVDYGTEYNSATWVLDNEPVWVNKTTKYTQNATGLFIYDVTVEDQGNYVCFVGPLTVDILVYVICKCIII